MCDIEIACFKEKNEFSTIIFKHPNMEICIFSFIFMPFYFIFYFFVINKTIFLR